MGFSGFRHNPADYARSMCCPTLILHGEEDPRATIEQARNILVNLAGPKRIEVFGEVGHGSCRDAAPERWKEAVSQFLKPISER